MTGLKLRPGYTLVIAEKPRAASKIAAALGLKRKATLSGVPFWYGYFQGRYYVVASSAGHLFSLKSEGRGYPVFEYRWVPRWEAERGSSFLKKFYSALSRLFKNARDYVNACDYDIEGSVIGYLIIKHFGNTTYAKRAKFSSLTREELLTAFKNLSSLDVDMVEAGLCRHELDWLWGVNVSRALMDFYRAISGRFLILSAGRVQTPTLVEVLNRYVERETFVPDISFNVSVTVKINGKKYKLENLFPSPVTKAKAKEIALKVKNARCLKVRKVEKTVRKLNPPPPFNLPDLQMEASRVFGISPAETLRIAENLYLESLISYPRTNSQKLPPALDNRRIIRSLSRLRGMSTFCEKILAKDKLRPVQGKREDPAHPAIYPTGYLPKKKLRVKEWNIYEMIVRRYLATFYDAAEVASVRYVFSAESLGSMSFALIGQRVVRPGWLSVYKYVNVKESSVPELKEGDCIEVERVSVVRTYSKPPRLYTKASLLRWMESVGIGTEATRAEIIETLFQRGYLKTTRAGIVVTELGIKTAFMLLKLFKELTEVNLTRDFEEKIERVRKGEISRQKVVDDAKEFLKPKLLKVKEMITSNDIGELRKLAEEGHDVKCAVCGRYGRYVVGGFSLCELHWRAYKNIVMKYRVWRERAGLSFDEYIASLKKLSCVGGFCKDVIKLLAENGFKPQS